MGLVSDGAGDFVIGVFMCTGGGWTEQGAGPFFISVVPGMLGICEAWERCRPVGLKVTVLSLF